MKSIFNSSKIQVGTLLAILLLIVVIDSSAFAQDTSTAAPIIKNPNSEQVEVVQTRKTVKKPAAKAQSKVQAKQKKKSVVTAKKPVVAAKKRAEAVKPAVTTKKAAADSADPFITSPKVSTNTASSPTGTATTTSAVVEQTKPWSILVGADQYIGFYQDAGQITQITLSPSYKINDRNTVAIVQQVDKFYEIPQINGQEFVFSDMSLRHFYLLSPDIYGASLKWRTSVTLPISTLSRESGNITRVGGMAIASKKFFDFLTLTYRPFVSYSFNKFTTTVGGNPLRKASVGNYFDTQIDITEKLNLAASLMGAYGFYEKTEYDNNPRRTNGEYSIDTSVNYELVKSLGAHVGYSYSNTMIHEGRYEMNVFDYQKSRWSLGLEYTF